jgi:hypothetical protein
MDLSKYKEALGEEAFAALSKYVVSLEGQRDEARQESIAGRKSLKSEVEALRKVKNTLYDKLGLDDDADLDAVVLPTKGAEVEAKAQYERQIKKLQTELATTQESYKGLESKHRGSLTDAALQKAIAAHQFVDNDLVTEFAKGRIKFSDDGELTYVEGDKVLSVEEGVKLIASTKPHLLKAQGSGGSGFNPNAKSGQTKAFNEMTLKEKSELYTKDPTAYKAAQAAVQPKIPQVLKAA